MQKTVKSILCASTLILAVSVVSGCTDKKTPEEKAEAVHPETKKMIYLGVENYGAEETNKDNKDHFRYRFSDDGSEVVFSIDNGKTNAAGAYDYPVQNVLKEGYTYNVTFQGETVTAAEEIEDGKTEYTSYSPEVVRAISRGTEKTGELFSLRRGKSRSVPLEHRGRRKAFGSCRCAEDAAEGGSGPSVRGGRCIRLHEAEETGDDFSVSFFTL